MAALKMLFCWCLLLVTSGQQFTEQLYLKPLSDGKILTHFQFSSSLEVNFNEKVKHYGVFPRSIMQIFQNFDVEELHLTLSKTLWNYKKWGFPITPAPLGAELHAWMKSSDDIDEKWKGLTNTLSGHICSSLNFIDKTLTSEPILTFQTNELYLNKTSLSLKHGALPHESICTENLTPWVKLLPCQNEAGLGELLNPIKVFDSYYHSMGIHYQKICLDKSCEKIKIVLSQTLSIVYNFNEAHLIQTLFGKQIQSTCPLSSNSKVILLDSNNIFDLSPQPHKITKLSEKQSLSIYDLKNEDYSLNKETTPNWKILPFDISFQTKPSQDEKKWIQVTRKVIGATDERGKIETRIENVDSTKNISIVYFESIPWILRVYLHSLELTIDGKIVEIEKLYLQPSRSRERPTVIELSFELAPKAVAVISFNFEKEFLKISEHLPDANRGFDISGAIVTFSIPGQNFQEPFIYQDIFNENFPQASQFSKNQEKKVRIGSDSFLIPMPTPDFSMPYNVITLTCTVLALCFGSIFNMITREFVRKDENTQPTLIKKIAMFFKKKKD